MSTAKTRGPQLPAYEVDTLGWLAQRLTSIHFHGDGIRAEVLTGESAILLLFPSGSARVLYLDEEPNSGGVPVSFIESKRIRAELEEARDERDDARELCDDAESRLHDARAVIASARALLERIEIAQEDVPDWLRDGATTFLTA